MIHAAFSRQGFGYPRNNIGCSHPNQEKLMGYLSCQQGHITRACLCAWLCMAACTYGRDVPLAPETATGYQAKALAKTKKYMVAAANPLAVEAGVKILEQGGSAVDAAIAVQMVLNLVEPQSSGIGGGAFMLHYDAKTKQLAAYDGRETAPQSATPDMFLDANGQPQKFYDAVVGGKSVGVPGLLRMLEMAHARHGAFEWKKLFRPAITLAEKGFPISPRLHGLLAKEKFLARNEAAGNYFYELDGTPKAVNKVIYNQELANTLKQVAQRGSDGFYEGDIACDLVATVAAHAENPGKISLDDLRTYRAKAREALCGRYRAYKICSMPPPSSGGIALLQMMGMLEPVDMSSLRPNSAAAVHYMSEAGRLAYADRARYVADSDFVDVPVAGLLDRAYIAQRAALIQPEKSIGTAQPGEPAAEKISQADDNALEFMSTSHISIVDAKGNAVSMTTTIEDAFGSRQMVHGFLLNNQMTDFSFAPTENGLPVANRIAAGKRPRSSMTPIMIFDADDQLIGIIGSPGGSAIINYVAKTVIGVLDWKLDIQQAIDLPNFGSRNGPTELEQSTDLENISAALKAMEHDVKLIEMNSGLHGILRTKSGWQGGADPRREGVARGK
jgi:gamma-glutamyltranspeptidase / glutathione hydrolase